MRPPRVILCIFQRAVDGDEASICIAATAEDLGSVSLHQTVNPFIQKADLSTRKPKTSIPKHPKPSVRTTLSCSTAPRYLNLTFWFYQPQTLREEWLLTLFYYREQPLQRQDFGFPPWTTKTLIQTLNPKCKTLSLSLKQCKLGMFGGVGFRLRMGSGQLSKDSVAAKEVRL